MIRNGGNYRDASTAEGGRAAHGGVLRAPRIARWRARGRIDILVLSLVLTAAVVGSALYLFLRNQERREESVRIQQFVDGLNSPAPGAVDNAIAFLRARPSLAARVLPHLVRRVRKEAFPTDQRLTALRVTAAFVTDDPRVAEAVYRMRLLRDPDVAAEAVGALGAIRPPEQAAGKLASCLAEPADPGVVDVACEQMVGLGAAGRAAIQPVLPRLSVERRGWLAGFVADSNRPDALEWLTLLSADPAPAVRERAVELIQQRRAASPASAPSGRT